jgi:hypothetical protein
MQQSVSAAVEHAKARVQQADDCFAWIDTLVCDFVYWYLNQFESERISQPKSIARQFGMAWKMRFVQAQSIEGGIEHVTALVKCPLPVESLQSVNAMVAQELKLFFLSRTHEPMQMRLSQAKFVDLQSSIIDRNLVFCADLQLDPAV